MTTSPTTLPPEMYAAIERELRATFFAKRPAQYFLQPGFRKDMDDHVEKRYAACRDRLIPWASRYVDFSGARVLEIGCGTGSSTAAFAEVSREVFGYDIVLNSVQGAERRLAIMGVGNAHVVHEQAARVLERVTREHAAGVDVIVLYAVLEHMTIAERFEALGAYWNLLRPGGVVIIGDTPNRLIFNSQHTSGLPFFDWLPDEVALRYFDRSPRAGFVDEMRRVTRDTPSKASEVLDRWGRGVSYHEFELALGDLNRIVVGDGFDPEVVEWMPLAYDEALLASYFVHAKIDVPLGFARRQLLLVLRKPREGDPERAERRSVEFRAAGWRPATT